MKVLVTGANGFIGSHVVKLLLQLGKEVKILVRRNSNLQNIRGLDVEFVYGDIRDKDALKNALDGCNVVYHLAAYYSNRGERELMYEINVKGTKNLLEIAFKNNIEKLIYTSTIGTIGRPENNNTLPNEETAFNLWDVASDYVKSKYLAECEVMKFFELGLPAVIVHPCAPVGAGDIKPSVSGQKIVDYLNGKLPLYPKMGINWIYVKDVAWGHVLVAQKGKLGERYILGNKNLTRDEFLALMKKITETDFKTFRRTATLRNRLWSIIGIKRERLYLPVLTCDCSKAVKELGLPQTPIEIGFKEAIEWFIRNNYVGGKQHRW